MFCIHKGKKRPCQDLTINALIT